MINMKNKTGFIRGNLFYDTFNKINQRLYDDIHKNVTPWPVMRGSELISRYMYELNKNDDITNKSY